MKFIAKMIRVKTVLRPLVLLFVAASFLAGCASLPKDGAEAKLQRFDNLRPMRYCEVFLIGGDAVTKDLQAAFYNTTDLNNSANPRDTCPAVIWDKVDAESMKKRKSQMAFQKGKPVFILEDPNGMPWVMQAYSLIVDPNLTYDDLQTLDKKLKLPPGWKYRVKVLDQDLTIRAVDGHARIVQDDLENTYDACFETACSHKP